ncbi:exonuclease SbcCD subunit D C-terminal domain-containing protein [Photobacterium damselae subsp. piscicida]|nr:exonuclease SbcCD subunit D C-terminal domain-containing protein [Photobacterium damselae subsp. piscicida]
MRYSGSPIPLSMSERNYKHQILAVELDGNGVTAIDEINIPRSVDMLKAPAKPAPLDEVLAVLKALPDDELPREQQPFLEVHVLLDKPQALLREKVLQALEGKAVRLAKITPHYNQREQQDSLQHRRLSDVSPQQVFALSWNKKFDGEPTEAIVEAFETLLKQVEEQDEER